MAMTLEQLEEEVKKLKKKVEENSRAKDYLEIWKLQSAYAHFYHVGRNPEVPGLFAQKTPGVTMEIEDSGVYEGIDSVRRFWTEVFSPDSPTTYHMPYSRYRVNRLEPSPPEPYDE